MNRARILIGLAVLLTACSAAPVGTAGSPQPSRAVGTDRASLTVTPTPSPATPTPTLSPGASGIGPETVAEVVTNDLVVRSEPGLASTSEIHRILLNEGILLWVLGGPVTADGFEWFRVIPFEDALTDTPSELPEIGWVAAGDEGESWIAPWRGSCPTRDVASLGQRPAAVRIACFGDSELELTGDMGGCSATTGNRVTPSWLFTQGCILLPSGADLGGLNPWMMLAFRDIPMPVADEYVPVRVLGHFDDAEARNCRYDLVEVEQPAAEVIPLECRGQFVVTEVTYLGD